MLLVAAITAGYQIWEPAADALGLAVGEVAFDRRPLRYWTRQLQSGPAERAAALHRLRDGGPEAVPVLTNLLTHTGGRDPELRWTAAQVLGEIGPDASAAETALLSGLRDPDPHVRAVCAAALPLVSVPPETAVPALVEQLERVPTVALIDALSDYRGGASGAIAALVAIIDDEGAELDLRRSALHALGRIGPDAADTLPTVLNALRNAHPAIRRSAADAVAMIGESAAADGIPALISALSDESWVVRRSAADALWYFGEDAAPAVPELQRLLNDPVEQVREAAQATLLAIAPGELSPTGSPALEVSPSRSVVPDHAVDGALNL